MRLSQEKARACVNFLTREKKIEPTKITPKVCGEDFLLIDEKEIKKVKTKKRKGNIASTVQQKRINYNRSGLILHFMMQ